MRFALRNKTKLVEKLGQSLYDSLIKSLKEYGNANDDLIIGTEINGKQSLLTKSPIQDQQFQFVIIRKTFDVYTVAYYSTLKYKL